MRTRTLAAMLVGAALGLTACGGSPKIHYYTLLAPAAERTDGKSAERVAATRIIIGPVHLPESVDRAQMVVRTGDNALSVQDDHRWAEPLKGELMHFLTAETARAMSPARVVEFGNDAERDGDLRIAVDVLRFDSELGKRVTLEAQWTLSRRSDGLRQDGHSLIGETVGGSRHEDLAAAHARALRRMVREISAVASRTASR